MNEDILYKLWLSRLRISSRGQLLLLELFGGAEGVYRASEEDLRQIFTLYGEFPEKIESCGILYKDLTRCKEAAEDAARIGARIITIEDAEYPAHLKSIPQAPLLLFCRGDLSMIRRPGVAVVGTRRCSPYGRWAAGEIARRVAACGLPVISGMAEGIDTYAHKGALEAGGRTAAVLGTGPDVCFPKSNESLFKRLLQDQLIISEYLPGDHGYPSNFPKRNRIISGLAAAVIVVEGAIKSGSMITATLAGEQGREVFAVPGNINQPNSIGVNRLIAEGAIPICDLDAIPSLLGVEVNERKKERRENLSPEENKLLQIIEKNNNQPTDFIISASGFSAAECRSLLASLELKALICCDSSRVRLG